MTETDRLRGWRRALVLGAALLGVAAVMTLVQLIALNHARDAAGESIDRLEAALRSGDVDAARAAAIRLDDAAGTAWLATRGPVWWAAGALPGIGDDVRAVRTSTEVADALTDGPMADLVAATSVLVDLGAVGDRLDLAAIERSGQAVRDADHVVGEQVRRLERIDVDGLRGSVRTAVVELRSMLTDAGDQLGRVADATSVLPGVLGGDATRTYLVLVQNNAEVRAGGGMPGAIAVLTVDDGEIRLAEQGAARLLGEPLARPVLPLTEDELFLFGPKLATFPADLTFTPDFPRAAELARAFYERRTGQLVDGVIATDPVALSYVVRGTGPLRVGDELLRGREVVDELLNGVYLDHPDPAAQDAVFRRTAHAVFRRLTSGRVDTGHLVDALGRAAGQGRLRAWSAHPGEQAVLGGTVLSGELPVHASDRPEVGVYLNDGTGAKLSYYLDRDVTVTSLGCDDGVQRLQVTATMTSSVPAGLPPAVLGPGYGVKPGVIRTNLLTYAPVGGTVVSSTLDGEPVTLPPLVHHGRAVATLTVDLRPGERVTVSHVLTSGPDQPGRPRLAVTPGLGGDSQVAHGRC